MGSKPCSRFKEARECLDKMTARLPDNASAQNDAAWILVDPEGHEELRDAESALPLARRAVELTKRANCYFLDTLAWALFWNGTVKAAVQTEEEAIAILEKRKATEADLKDYRKALQRFKAALKQQQ